MTVDEKETTMSDEAFGRIAGIAIKDAGLSIPISKKALVQSRIARRVRVLGLNTVEEYLSIINEANNKEERRELISILTTNVSSFYREQHHFQHLTNNVFAKLKNNISAGKPVRIWSAGCSSGQEPYTIGIEILKYFSSSEVKDILILASDIDPSILNKARLGRYSQPEISAIPEHDQRNFFEDHGDKYEVSDKLRSLIRFRELNLHAQWPMTGVFDAIFCRNVLIYFDELHQQTLWPRFRNALVPGGYLYLGHSERIHPLDTSGFASIGSTIYQKTT
jgi:chemotaxis protein methyltransferase CheR